MESSTGTNSPTVETLDEREHLVRRAANTPGLISFAGGLPDPALFPKRQLSRAFVSALQSNAASALQYGWPEGAFELRKEIATDLAARGAAVAPERIIVTSGAQQAIQLAVSVAGSRPRIGVESESYAGALEIFRDARARPVPIEDEAKLYYVMPAVSNPRGQSMTMDERRALLARARRCKGYIIEDDAYEGIRFSGAVETPLLATHPERVFHVGTYSKTLCPGLRIGWLVPPRRLAKQALRHKQTTDLQTNGMSQALLIEYLRSGHLVGLKRRARAHYRRKLQCLLSAVRRRLPEFTCTAPVGGFSLWLESHLPLKDTRLLELGILQGVSFDLGQQFRTVPDPNLAIRLCYSAVPEADIEAGVARIARALRRLAHE
ncbi:MAG TPA: PLP-dependent aminotransferase family protein [Polyangiaceae bacterium]